MSMLSNDVSFERASIFLNHQRVPTRWLGRALEWHALANRSNKKVAEDRPMIFRRFFAYMRKENLYETEIYLLAVPNEDDRTGRSSRDGTPEGRVSAVCPGTGMASNQRVLVFRRRRAPDERGPASGMLLF